MAAMLRAETHRRVFIGLLVAMLVLLVGVGVLAGNLLRLAHAQIDGLNPPLPEPALVRQSLQVKDLPTQLRWYNSATQSVPRSLVLDPETDPEPGGNYDMGFTAFVLSWSDGRQFVIDAGLSADETKGFGRPLSLLGAGDLTFHGELTSVLEPTKVQGLGFSHLHIDHTAGAMALCDQGGEFTLVQTVEQYNLLNYMTFAPADSLDTLGCSRRLLLANDGPLRSVQGFPGLYLIHVAGHTPGSQVFVAHVRQGRRVTTYLLAGDIANHMAGIKTNTAKPAWYSRWVIPENPVQLDQVRRWLAKMDAHPSMEVLVAHDLQQLQRSSAAELASQAATMEAQNAP